MNEESDRDPEDLQFEKADVPDDSSDSMSCHFCQSPLSNTYFEINGQPSCEKCRYEVEEERSSGSSVGRVSRALLAGTAAAAAGALIYYGVAALTGYEFGLIAIIVGVLVGVAVKWGSRGRGGWVYQTLAMLLTYLSIVSTYVPHIIEAIENEEMVAEMETDTGEEPFVGQTAVEASEETSSTFEADEDIYEITSGQLVISFVIFILFIMAMPFLAGFENIIGLIIIGIGLYEAWKINRLQPFAIEGPFQVGSGPS